jgi:hypothetical protein
VPDAPLIAFDSNVLSAFIRANNGDLDGDPAAVEERIAAYRLFLYAKPVIMPSVSTEANAIRDHAKHMEHWRFIAGHFDELLPDPWDRRAIEARAADLKQHHPGEADCRILAEAEAAAVPVRLLATIDGDFRKRLAPHARLPILSSSDGWNALAVPRGAEPQRRPGPGHPLEHATWWRW